MKFTSGFSHGIFGFLYEKFWVETPSDASRFAAFRSAALKILSLAFLKVFQDAIPFRARGLALTVALAMVPMLALGTAILKGVGVAEETQHLAHAYLDRMVLSRVFTGQESAGSHQDGAAAKEMSRHANAENVSSEHKLLMHVQRAVDKIFDYINRTDFATLGFVGTAVILLLVASFFSNLETSMNTIWEVRKGRSPWIRGINYLVVLILLPIAMNLGFAAMAILQSSMLMTKIQIMLPAPWIISFLLKLFPAFVVIGTFAALYKFIPNTRVSTRYAITGGALAGLTWLVVLWLYLNLQFGMARYNAIYGSFAIIPLILLWIYMGWVIFLAGAELVFAFQVWREYDLKAHHLNGDRRLALAIDVFRALTRAQASQGVLNAQSLAEKLERPRDHISDALNDLERIGLIERGKGRDQMIVVKEGISPLDVS